MTVSDYFLYRHLVHKSHRITESNVRRLYQQLLHSTIYRLSRFFYLVVCSPSCSREEGVYKAEALHLAIRFFTERSAQQTNTETYLFLF
jgi:hypothetical protein